MQFSQLNGHKLKKFDIVKRCARRWHNDNKVQLSNFGIDVKTINDNPDLLITGNHNNSGKVTYIGIKEQHSLSGGNKIEVNENFNNEKLEECIKTAIETIKNR